MCHHTYMPKPETAYRENVERLSTWCRANDLFLNTSKTKELIIDYRKKKTDIPPLIISGDCVVADFRFLGVHIEESLLRILKSNNIAQRLLVSFYRASIERILTYCMCVLYTSCTVAQSKAL